MQAIVKTGLERCNMTIDSKDQKTLCNCTALRKATRRVSQLYDSALEPCGLRATQRTILSHIARAGAPALGELAEALVMDRGALTHNLKPLQRDGMVKISVDPQDRRNRLIALTAHGRTKLAESDALWARAQRGFEASFGVAKSASLRKALEYLVSDDFVNAFSSHN
jgi:DNA-binding MarR family transcriptional regulator